MQPLIFSLIGRYGCRGVSRAEAMGGPWLPEAGARCACSPDLREACRYGAFGGAQAGPGRVDHCADGRTRDTHARMPTPVLIPVLLLIAAPITVAQSPGPGWGLMALYPTDWSVSLSASDAAPETWIIDRG